MSKRLISHMSEPFDSDDEGELKENMALFDKFCADLAFEETQARLMQRYPEESFSYSYLDLESGMYDDPSIEQKDQVNAVAHSHLQRRNKMDRMYTKLNRLL